HATDAQFSSVAVLLDNGSLLERVAYSPYGVARHQWPADASGDGAVNSADLSIVLSSYGSITSSTYRSEADFNRDGSVDAADLAAVLSYAAALPEGALSSAGIANRTGYCGYRFAPETEMYLARNRWNSPPLGRWLRRDPAGSVDGLNLYEIVRASPVRYIDPLGMDAWDTSGPAYRDMNAEQRTAHRKKIKECVVRKLKELKARQDTYADDLAKYEAVRATNPNATAPTKPEMYDCADSAMTMLARCSKEHKSPLRLWASGKWYSHRDYNSIEAFEEDLRRNLGALNLMDHQNTRPQAWKDLEPGDLLLWDLRSHEDRSYGGHAAVVTEKKKCGESGEPCWKVIEGRLTGGMQEGEYTQPGAKDRWPGPERKGPLWEDRGRYWNWPEIGQ
ncbi:MAG: dockerin type I domain-containing protein, partial [Planctomycetota bacterium]|nr:dockerin type I domain-containing protein [Planctomycetota bacterium]